MELIQLDSLINLLGRMAVNFTAAFLLIFGIYKTSRKGKSFLFSLFMFNLIIFIMGNMISNTEWTVGAGLGLFAIFTILRYRSETLQLKEMTYLFILIAIGFINAIGNTINWTELILLNLSVVGLSSCLERTCLSRLLISKKIKYNDLALIRPEHRQDLAQDVYMKTGIRAKEIEVESINFQDNTVNLILYYPEVLASPLKRREKMLTDPLAETGAEEKIKFLDNTRGLKYKIYEK
ncbi:MAG: DUF4956 domain-containing protein [Cyclobacteriaceae bacterium]|nr:DUF4956 domain-containing protein [Cyclobacteriaceae bacterium]